MATEETNLKLNSIATSEAMGVPEEYNVMRLSVGAMVPSELSFGALRRRVLTKSPTDLKPENSILPPAKRFRCWVCLPKATGF